MFNRIINLEQGESFDSAEEARHYAAHMEKFAFMYNDFLAALKDLNPYRTMLEIGAGTGLLTYRMAQKFSSAKITALEISPFMAECGKDYLTKKGVSDRVSWVVGDADNGGVLTSLGKFDLVYSGLALHHFPDAKSPLTRFYTAVADGGTMAILDLRRVWWLYWIPSQEGFFTSIKASYLPGELRAILNDAGINNAEVRRLFPFLMMLKAKKG